MCLDFQSCFFLSRLRLLVPLDRKDQLSFLIVVHFSNDQTSRSVDNKIPQNLPKDQSEVKKVQDQSRTLTTHRKMIKATADAETVEGRTLVSTVDTVAPKVEYQNRSYTDVWFAVIYVLSYIAFLACGFTVVAKSRSKYEVDENGDKEIAADFMEAYQTCCSATSGSNSGDLCSTFGYNDGNRRLSAGGSKFIGDEGIFDAFIDAPEIIVGLIGLTMGEYNRSSHYH